MTNNRIAAGVGLFLALEVINTYQLVLPPIYDEKNRPTPEQIKTATKWVAGYVLIVAFITGALTESHWPVLLPAIAIGAVYLFYLMEANKHTATTILEDEE